MPEHRQERFIFGLWSPPANNPELVARWQRKTAIEFTRAAPLMQRLGASVYVIGDASLAVARSAGLDFTALPPEPDDPRRNLLWRHKLRIIQAAAQKYRAVVWLDSDMLQHGPIPDDFWSRLNRGASIQLKLRYYHRNQCWWRGRGSRRTSAAGAFIYCRDAKIVSVAMDYQMEHGCDDEVALSWAIDQMYGGWQGVEHWLKSHDPPYYGVRGHVRPPEPMILSARS